MEVQNYKLIKDNLPKLTKLTFCSTILLTKLVSQRVLSDEDQEVIEAEQGNISRASKLYRILLTKEGAFTTLLDALEETRQTGALGILKTSSQATIPKKRISRFLRAPQFITDYLNSKRAYALVVKSDDCQLTIERISERVSNAKFFEPHTFLEEISNTETDLQNFDSLLVIDCRNGLKSCLRYAAKVRWHCALICQIAEKIQNNCNILIKKDELSWDDLTPLFQSQIEDKCLELLGIQLEELDDIQQSLGHDDILKLIKGQVPLMFNDHLPEQISYYIDRSLVTRYILSDDILSHNGRDKFFIHGIERPDLSVRVRGKSTETSSEVLYSDSTAKFVVLEHEYHFEIISNRLKDIPLHYIIHKGKQFIWHRSTGSLQTIQKYIHSSQDKIDEDELLKNLCKERNQTKTIGISDAPGMGKSILLANFARNLKAKAKPWQNYFMIISEVFKKYLEFERIHDLEERVSKALESCLCATKLGKAVFRSSKLQVKDIFLDGLDEITSDTIEDAYEFLRIIRKVFRNSRIWVTTRPQRLLDLENSLNTLVYNIEPFSEHNQINFLKWFWSRNSSCPKPVPKYEKFAKGCLLSIKSTMDSERENDIAGIPLQCLLIGEVFEDEANIFSKCDQEHSPIIQIISIAELYEKLIDKKTKKYFERYDKRGIAYEDVIRTHIDLSLLLLFPSFREKNVKFLDTHGVNEQEILNVGLLESVLPVPKFIHRTFAEYFVAKFIIMLLEANNIDLILELFFKQILETLECYWPTYYGAREFKHGVICFFIDSLISKYSLTINWKVSSNNVHEKLTQETVKQIAEACAYSSFESIFFEIVCKLPYFSYVTANVFDERFLFTCTANSKTSMLEKVLDKFLSVNNKISSFSKILVANRTLLHVAAERGNYAIFERISNLEGFRALLSANDDFTHNIVYHCIRDTQNDNMQTINERIRIVKFLAKINQNWLKETIMDSLLSEHCISVHVIVLIELLELAEAVKPQTSESLANLFHRATNKYNSDEYHKLLVYIKQKYDADMCKVIFNSSKDSFSLLGSILERIKLDDKMCQFIPQCGFQVFNDESEEHNPIVIALKSHQQTRIIEWLISEIPTSQVQSIYESCRKYLLKYLPSKSRFLLLDKFKVGISSLEITFAKWDWLVRHGELEPSVFEELGGMCVDEIGHINAINGDGNTFMHIAAQNLNILGVLFLLKLEGSLTLRNKVGHTPLDAAAAKVNGRKWGKISKENSTRKRLEHFILFACQKRYLEGVKFFCGWYAHFLKMPVQSIKTEIGGKVCSILDALRRCRDLEMIEYFVTNHAFIEAYRASNQTSILFDCVKIICFSDRQRESLRQIIKLHADTLNSPDENGIVPLSTRGIYADNVKLLVDGGADVNLVDSAGNTPLHWALKHDQDYVYSVVRELIFCGADVNAENVDHETPLHLALNLTDPWDIYYCVKALINDNADIRRRDSFGDTFLHILPSKLKSYDFCSKVRQFHEILNCLLKKGDSDALSLLGKDNLTPIQVASQHFTLLPETLEILKIYNVTL